MNKTELIAAIAEHAEVKKSVAEKVLNSFFAVVPQDLAANKEEEGYKIQIMGFGTFKASFVAGRSGVNPQDRSQKVEIPDGYRVHFSAGQVFKDVVNDVVKEKAAPKKKATATKTKIAPAKTAVKSKKKKKK